MKNIITKTSYVRFWKCPRCFYYFLNNSDKKRDLTLDEENRIQEGLYVGKVAHSYFENTIKIKDNNNLDITKQIQLTKKYLQQKKFCIAEASFLYKNLFCAIDLFVKDEHGYSIYEVKSTKDINKKINEFYADVSFQKYVLEKLGFKINKCYILYLNGDYIFEDKLDIKKLFSTCDLTNQPQFINECKNVENIINEINKAITSIQIPEYGKCEKSCQFFSFCHRDLPEDNILQLNRIRLAYAHNCIKQGIITFDEYKKCGEKITPFQLIQINTFDQPHIDKEAIKRFLKKIQYPLYFLDFETCMKPIPFCNGLRPYQQVVFQYSLHICKKINGEYIHREYLGRKYDCEYDLAKHLINDIPPKSCVIAYHVSTEREIIIKLAKRFPDLRYKLLDLLTNIIDLIDVFKNGDYYNKKQKGSNSIKAVMPAVCPNMENAYKTLPIVHNGTEALTMFSKLLELDENSEEYQKIRQGMLDYCCLDTLSMVKILEQLYKISK